MTPFPPVSYTHLNSYGAKAGSSWGEKENVKDYDNAGNWFSNGVTAINSVSVMTGNEKLQTYFSYANTTAKGIVDSNKLRKHNLTLRESASLFNDRLKLDANANLMVQTIKNSPTSGGIYLNPLVDVYGFPRGQDLSEYATNFEKFDENRNMPVQSWFTTPSEWTQNPVSYTHLDVYKRQGYSRRDFGAFHCFQFL